VTHVMIYLGKLKKTGKRVIFGASDGRAFEGHRRSGVSVFDFSLPKAEGLTRLYGYGLAPGLMPALPPIIATKPAALVKTKEEVRKAEAIMTETKPEPELKPVIVKPEPKAEPKKTAPAETKPKKATKKKSTMAAKPKKRVPAPPQKSQAEKTIQRAVDSVRKFFR